MIAAAHEPEPEPAELVAGSDEGRVALAVHCTVTIAAHTRAHKLTSGQVAVLQALWGRVDDQWAVCPSVHVSYRLLSDLTGLAEATIKTTTSGLARLGTLRKCGSARGLGTRYVLLPAESVPDDLLYVAPRERPAVATLTALVDGLSKRVAAPKRKPKRERSQVAAVRPSDIAAALESIVGAERGWIRYKGHAGIEAAGKWIREQGYELADFQRTCAALVGRVDRERVPFLFERPAEVAALLGSPAHTETQISDRAPVPTEEHEPALDPETLAQIKELMQ